MSEAYRSLPHGHERGALPENEYDMYCLAMDVRNDPRKKNNYFQSECRRRLARNNCGKGTRCEKLTGQGEMW